MIKHIVLFKLKTDLSSDEKKSIAQNFKNALESLKGKIPCLLSIEVGVNENAEESYDIALTTTFETFDDLHNYAQHPDHVKVSDFIAKVRTDRAVADIEV